MPLTPAHRARASLLAGLAGIGAAAEWLRTPAPAWAWLVLVAGVLLLGVGWRWGFRGRLVGIGLLGLGVVLYLADRHLARFDAEWPLEREARVTRAFQRLSGELQQAYAATDRAADRAVQLADGDRAAAFAALDRDLPRGGAETAVAILESTGVPWAWAGRHRLAPRVEGAALDARLTRFYGTLESRRTSPGGRVIVASTLVWADSSVPRADRSLAARFGAAAGVQLRIFAPGQAPPGADLFDYTVPGPAGDRLLFSLQPVPPDQSAAEREALHLASGWVALGLVALLLLTLLAASGTPARIALLLALVWATLRAPLGAALGADLLFSPATFFRGSLRPVTESAGHLLVTGVAALLLALWLWQRQLPRRGWRVALGLLVLLGTPYLIAEMGRGVSPPLSGVTTGLWLGWSTTLTVATTALIVLAAALLRGEGTPAPGWRGVLAGTAIAVTAAVIGIEVWQPRGGWPEWYTFLWTPALVLVALPRARWSMIVGAALVAGTAAALVTWGAEQAGRVTAAQRDLARLGDVDDPLAEPLLERFSEQVDRGPEPLSETDLFLLWRASDLAGQEFPARLALWGPDGGRLTGLALDSLDLPLPLEAALVASLGAGVPRAITTVRRVPGHYTVMVQRLASGRLLTAAVGPRSRLLPPTRLARMLRAPAEGPPLYELGLSLPYPRRPAVPEEGRWWRDGRTVLADRMFSFPGGVRHVHARVEFRPLSVLLVRATLLIIADLVLVLLVGVVAAYRWGEGPPRVAPRRWARSYQVRLALALAGFFVLPAVGFAFWGLGRLQDEADRTRDLLITSVLRDAVLTAGGLLQEPAAYLDEGLVDLSNRLDADLVLYSGGRLVAASAPVLEELALVEPLMEARTFQRMALGDEVELTRQATTYVAPVRVGYRVAQAGPPGGIGILATPQLTYDWTRTRDQLDLTYLLLFATVAGMGAAIVGAQLAARALSRPVADLRRSARALGQGQPLPTIAAPPAEFEAVFTAFGRMAEDIRESQSALERARHRTAAVLANVATGVVALDGAGRVIVANARARALLGEALPEGAELAPALAPGWGLLLETVRRFRAGGEPGAELERDGRVYRVQLAALGRAATDGLVIAMDDITEAARAARVVAWGEMARQVAHEIKNPLTPMRLGVQHLRRVRRERPEQFEGVVEETTQRILAEIDRLDTIARAFSRFGLPGNLIGPLEPVDLAGTASEVAALYQLGGGEAAVTVEGATEVHLPARRDEVKEVLGNLIENARNAAADRVTVTIVPLGFQVADNGRGIPAELLPRIFEPRFSTTTSGSGLGLAIVRRLVEGWGAAVAVDSAEGAGTTVRVSWPAVASAGP